MKKLILCAALLTAVLFIGCGYKEVEEPGNHRGEFPASGDGDPIIVKWQREGCRDWDVECKRALGLDTAETIDSIPMVFVEGGALGDTTVSGFYISTYECTQGLWKAVMGDCTFYRADNFPVGMVDWNKVQEFIQKLNAKTDKLYRLPTDAEWEYAARGGNKSNGYKYSGGNKIDDVAWYLKNSGGEYYPIYGIIYDMMRAAIRLEWFTVKSIWSDRGRHGESHPVGTKLANELGIYDMSGNVWEWTSTAEGADRVIRGGGYSDDAKYCRISVRACDSPDFVAGSLGFRLAHDAD